MFKPLIFEIMKYKVFKRTWWKRNSNWPKGLEPSPGRKRTVQYFDTIEDARQFCKFHNNNSLPKHNPLSLKYEFESV
jgi:hypothetical protein